VCYEIATLPFHVFYLFGSLATINPTINPLIYASRYDAFKRSLKQLISKGNVASTNSSDR